MLTDTSLKEEFVAIYKAMIGKEGDLEAVNRVYKDFVRKMSNVQKFFE